MSVGVVVRRTWQAACHAVCEVWAGTAVRVFALHSRPVAAKLPGVLHYGFMWARAKEPACALPQQSVECLPLHRSALGGADGQAPGGGGMSLNPDLSVALWARYPGREAWARLWCIDMLSACSLLHI